MISIPSNKIVFFDFDSTLADTEPYHTFARDTVLASYGVHISDWGPYLGNSDLSIFTLMKERYGLDMDIPAAIDTKLRIFMEQAEKAGLLPYPEITELVQTLPNRKFIITSQRQGIVASFLARWGLTGRFEDIISLAYSSMTKADKIIEMGFEPHDCILFDDRPRIVQEACDKGIQSMLVVDGKVSGMPGTGKMTHT